jgi:hypothetical protein
MIVHNPTDTAVRDYPIQDPKGGDVALWSILPGETLDFPDYAGKYLTQVYGFLQRVVTKEELKVEQDETEKLNQGKHFSPVKIVEKGATNAVMQAPAPTAEQLTPKNPVLTPPAQQSGLPPQPDMVGGVVGDEADKVPEAQPSAVPAPTVQPAAKTGGLVCPDCGKSFQNKAALKTHYAHQHLVLPGIS